MIQPTELRRISFFSALTDDTLAEIARALDVWNMPAGATLFEKGDPGNELFIIEAGSVALLLPDEEQASEAKPIRILRAGDMFGELALIDQQPRSLTARVVEAAHLLVLTRTAFTRLTHAHPGIGLAVMATLTDRLRYLTEFLNEMRGWVKRIADGNYAHDFVPNHSYADQSISALVAEFAQMATSVRRREEELIEQVEELAIQIDGRVAQDRIAEIIDTDFFTDLRKRAQALRDQDKT